MHPETIDAMDYLYAHDEQVLGLCTFCYYHMIEYGVRNPSVMVGGQIGGKPLTYVTDVRRTIATSGIWFPFHPVVTTDGGMAARCAAGTAPTSTTPPTSWSRRSSAATQRAGRASTISLENGVYSFQYHPGAGARSVRQRRPGHARLRALLPSTWPSGSNFWIATPARAVPAHGRLRGPGLPGARRRPRGDGGQSDRPAHRRDGDRAAAARSAASGMATRSWSTWCGTPSSRCRRCRPGGRVTLRFERRRPRRRCSASRATRG